MGRQRKEKAFFLACALVCLLTCQISGLAQEGDESERANERIDLLVKGLVESGCKNIAIVAVKDALGEREKELLLEKCAAAGLGILLKEVDLASAEELAADLEAVRDSDAEAVLPLGDASATQAILQQMRNLALPQPALLYEASDTGEPSLVKKGVMPVLETVLELERPSETDLVFLKNGDKLTGTVLNGSISIRTSYATAPPLVFETRLVAGILFEGQAYMETLFTVNANRFSGFIDDPAIVFKLAQGPELRIRKEKISKIIFRTRANELGGIQRNNLVILNNGDVISGVILNETFNVKTTYAKVAVEVSNIEHVAMISRQNVLTTIKMKETGDQIQGILEEEDIEVDLDCGAEIKVYQDRIKEIFFQRGYGKELDLEAVGLEGFSMSLAGARELTNSIDMKLVLIKPGQFQMGSPSSEPGRQGDEGPVHAVQITKPFYMSVTEMTQAQYERVMGQNPSHWKAPDLPVETVSWNDAVEFCRRLTELEERAGKLPDGHEYRLPTEAQWEYTCRAGTQTRFSLGDSEDALSEYAWYRENSDKRTHIVGQKKPNAWGLYDMSGNVWEWCADWYDSGYYAKSPQSDPQGPSSGSGRVLRGGSSFSYVDNIRSSTRYNHTPTLTNYNIGFRVVCEVRSAEDSR